MQLVQYMFQVVTLMPLVCGSMWVARQLCNRVGGLLICLNCVDRVLPSRVDVWALYISPLQPHLRIYSAAFARRILELWKEERDSKQPRLSMRQKVHVGTDVSDRELFEQLPMGDTWPDAEMVSVWAYLYSNKHLLIPQTWQPTMSDLNSKLLDTAPRLPWSVLQLH